ncbi:hypothetical protein [Microbacterium aurugineum]|uniref:hypothetical protein n=1 Tax=Microbacterium aurugineum TaxID=2851642 RepID=UPI0020BEED3E|nr:hypothetical protein [Microbacterium aurugineum]MCK8475614.1 hypothetical protein [Microbacterium aurugineum]
MAVSGAGIGPFARFAGEPVWAGVIGRIAGERLPVTALIGGALVVLGILASELKLVRRTPAERPSDR